LIFFTRVLMKLYTKGVIMGIMALATVLAIILIGIVAFALFVVICILL